LAEGVHVALVSENDLWFTDLFAIEFEIRREGPLHLTELIERFDNQSGEAHSQAVAPFGNVHS
jgi:hypothetical protein